MNKLFIYKQCKHNKVLFYSVGNLLVMLAEKSTCNGWCDLESQLSYITESSHGVNLTLFVVPENEKLVIKRDDNEDLQPTNKEKVEAIFSCLNCNVEEVSQFFRLGIEGDKPCPIKIVLKCSRCIEEY